ncbi:M81 family metallopeptidase [Oryzibacter oryziterrae]|uniref:M81 family metallopeptidase n=1 Tax=Oryzibacter oryziterrae TaxID=2766474 RepID=UPI001F19286B|nr:M81 family metallopeptidase [Oryzibacter oryziterrae]
MRVAVAGLHIECSTWNPVLTRMEEFRVLRGAALTAAPQFDYLAESTLEFVPLLHARAIPGGPVAREVYESLKAEVLERLAAAEPLDGVYLPMHGAMFVEGYQDVEGDFITAIRAAVGPDLPIATSYDLHGNVTARIVDAIDIFAAYRTAPHIDTRETAVRAVRMLERCLTTGEKPFVAYAPIPVLLPGERTATTDEPMKSLYVPLPAYDTRAGVWDANLMVGYVWADEPRSTATAVVTGTDRQAVAQVVETIAKSYFDVREACVFPVTVGSIDECVAAAKMAPTGPVILADSGDNPTGGGAGDRPDLLKGLISNGISDAVVAGIADPQATVACFAAGEGAEISTTVGAALDSINATPLPVRGKVLRLVEGAGGTDRQAVLDVGGIRVVLTAKRRPFHNITDFAALGIDPASEKLVVVKSGYLSPELAPLANPVLMALSPGVVDQDIERLPVRQIGRPMYPFDKAFSFAPSVHFSSRSGRTQ